MTLNDIKSSLLFLLQLYPIKKRKYEKRLEETKSFSVAKAFSFSAKIFAFFIASEIKFCKNFYNFILLHTICIYLFTYFKKSYEYFMISFNFVSVEAIYLFFFAIQKFFFSSEVENFKK